MAMQSKQGVHHPTRRTFLKTAGITLGASLFEQIPSKTAWASEEVFPKAEPGAVRVDPAKLAKAVEFIIAEVKAGSIPGAALVATRDGKRFVDHYTGICRSLDGSDQPYGPKFASPLFSFSKGITATVAVMCHQDGLIDYDLPVIKYIPEFTGGGKEAITLRSLMTHSAGIPSIPAAPVGTEEEWKSFVKTVCDASIEWPVGSRTAYHGISGMFVVAEAIRRASGGMAWNDILRKRLFDPLGARSFSCNRPAADIPIAIIPEYFKAKSLEEGAMFGHPAAGCFGTVDDMLRVLNMITQGGFWQGKRLIEPEPLKEMLTVQYAAEIDKAVAAGEDPKHEPWGLGWLLRGTAPKCGAAHWFGFGDSTSPTLFGHAGVETVYGDGDPARQLCYVFIMTDRPASADEATRLRREVSNLLQDAVLP